MLMNFLRERAGFIIIGFIGLAIVAFIVSDMFKASSPFLQDGRNKVGVIAGEDVSYQDFNGKVEQNMEAMKQQMGGNVPPQMAGYAQEQAWNQMVQEIVFKKQTEKTGITVGGEELFDLIQGKNPDPQIRRIFANPQTGEFDPKSVVTFLKNMETNDPTGATKKQWLDFEKNLQSNRAIQKYINMVSGAMYATSLELTQLNAANTKLANARLVAVPYSTVPDAEIKVEDSEIEKYYNDNKYKYKQKQDQRTIEYVVMDVVPSKEDSLAAQKDIDKVAADFRTSTQDSLFYMANADTKMPLTFMKKAQLDAKLDTALFNAAVGTVYGPYFENGAYKVAKLLGVKNVPDSVKARHILIGAQKGGLTPAGAAKADSLKKLVQSGKASFADLAKANSDDPGSGAKGGDLGYFGRNMMVPQFEQAAFNGKPGDLVVVQTQFGTHLIEVQDQKNVSKAVQVAVVDRVFTPSQSSRQTAFAKANSFVAGIKEAKSFTEAAEKAKLAKRISDNLNATGSEIPGLESSREITRWAFNAEQNDVSNVFETGDKYVVAHLIQIRNKGYVPLEYVKSEIEIAVRQQKKAEKLTEKVKGAIAGAASIDAVAQKLGAPVQPLQGVSFGNPVLEGAGMEPKLYGSIFGSQAGKIGKPVVGEKSVYAFVVDSFTNPTPIADIKTFRRSVEMMQKQASAAGTFEALQDKAKIVDNRGKFY
ncbi:peptidylprolyl isomerase [Solitalea lacus]|uniref:peptidylprolyl isomerase n=1 Tax=Solitalea lacus TaxID=2911172 RepID=UPI001EDC3FC3|nr:SurA N-terminal domain-containing protein [Solitalea lacus]UKJ08216.1 SurA N-terminal domain-containing protein [Solitalea lacus]